MGKPGRDSCMRSGSAGPGPGPGSRALRTAGVLRLGVGGSSAGKVFVAQASA